MESMSRIPGIPCIDEGGSRFEQMLDGMRAVRVRESVAPVMKPVRRQESRAEAPVMEANGQEMRAIEVLAALDAQLERGEEALKRI